MEKGEKIGDLRTRKRLEQQAIGVAKGKFDAAVKPVGPVNASKGGSK